MILATYKDRRDRARVAAAIVRTQAVLERRSAAEIYATMRATGRAASSAYVSGGVTSAAVAIAEHNNKLFKSIRKIYIDTITKFWNVKFKQDKKASTKKEFDDALNQYIRDFGLKKANKITGNSIEILRREIERGVEDGEGTIKIRNRIAAILGEGSKYRAYRIARTEVHSAANYGMVESVRSTGFEPQKEWATVIDGRERDAHREYNGTSVGFDEPFVVDGEELEYPGDPSGSAENVINCRCVMLFKEVA